MNNTITQKINELSGLKSKMDSLSQEIENERTNNLRALPEEFGYGSVNEFIDAVRSASRGNGKKARKAGVRSSQRKARVSITPDKRKEIVSFFKSDGSVVDAVTKFNISIATAQNIKKEAGMVNERK